MEDAECKRHGIVISPARYDDNPTVRTVEVDLTGLRARPISRAVYCGAMAEWLGSGLQIHARRFDSGSHLHSEDAANDGAAGLCKVARV